MPTFSSDGTKCYPHEKRKRVEIMSKYYSSTFEMFSGIFASVSVDLEKFRSDNNIFPTSFSELKAMDNIQKMIEARNLKHQMKKAKNSFGCSKETSKTHSSGAEIKSRQIFNERGGKKSA